jgi:hypothetical protein
VTPRKPPKPKGECPKGGNHQWYVIKEGGGFVTHKCRRCPATNTRRLDPNRAAS